MFAWYVRFYLWSNLKNVKTTGIVVIKINQNNVKASFIVIIINI